MTSKSGSDIYTHAQNHKYSILTPQMQDIHTCTYYPWGSNSSQPITSLLISHLLLQPWCIPINGYWISSNKCYSQQQPIACYRQTNKSSPGISQPTRVKTTTNRTHTWQFKYTNIIPVVLWMSSGLICG